jgi:ATP-dependent protease HslVU (ClpYQ) peptidase subunit
MTLIVTQFSHHGIVVAADSNVSMGRTLLGTRRKVFRVPTISAGIACAGSMYVGSKTLEDWMDEFIETEQTVCSDLRGFCDLLAASLNRRSHRGAKEETGNCPRRWLRR